MDVTLVTRVVFVDAETLVPVVVTLVVVELLVLVVVVVFVLV